jgi:hypothetical protein
MTTTFPGEAAASFGSPDPLRRSPVFGIPREWTVPPSVESASFSGRNSAAFAYALSGKLCRVRF